MKEWLLYGWEFLASFLPFLLVFAFYLWRKKRQGMKTSQATHWLMVLLAVYMVAVYHVTEAGTIYEGARFCFELRPSQINLIPFSRDIDVVGYLLNMALLFPLGFMAPLLWKRMDHLGRTILLGLAVSLLVEASQLLNPRSTDIDDLILNTLSAVLGFGVYRLWTRVTASRFALGDGPFPMLFLCILLPFLGRFLLFDEMSIARMLYGF